MRIVPDTNVLARAARPSSLAAKVLAQIINGIRVMTDLALLNLLTAPPGP